MVVRMTTQQSTSRGAVCGGLVAVALLMAMPADRATLRGEDDTVVNAAAERAREQPHQRQLVVVDQQLNAMVFQHEGGPEQSRRNALARLMLEVAALEDCVGLTERQRMACEAAAKLDVERAMDEIETVRRRYSGRTIDLADPAGQAEWQRFHQEAQPLQMKLQNLAGETGLLRAVIAGILDDEQRAAWQRESELRTAYQWQCVADAGLVQLDLALGLTTKQHEAIRGLLLEKPLRIDVRRIWQHGNHFPPFVCGYGLSRLDQTRLEKLLTEWQWKTLGQFMNQGRGMVEHLKQQKMIQE